jgi:hypothetical protein
MSDHSHSAPAHHEEAPEAHVAPQATDHVAEVPHAPTGVEAVTPQVKAACLRTLRNKVAAAKALDGAANYTDRHHISSVASLVTPGFVDAGVSAGLGVYATWKALSSGARLSTVAKTAVAGAAHTLASFVPVGSSVYKATMKPVSSSANRLWAEAEGYATEIVTNGVDHAAVQGILTGGRQESTANAAKVSGTLSKAVNGAVGTELGRELLAGGLDHVAGTALPRHRHVRTAALGGADLLREVNARARAAHAAHGHGGVTLPPLPAGWNYVPYPAGAAAPAAGGHGGPAPAPHAPAGHP